ncbi:carbon-nitrogen hydrolase family protein [Liquorilactobacillus sicerae]|uniref:carbon-nitrogen hydrolase family protein n=1 Tax=Liquorilactobacillus sicerae TaxID=1416943 RepID=UPI002480B57C|nr:carbon-nitrogen hydrolase family protein [Liquorilactobacillus sicerae]
MKDIANIAVITFHALWGQKEKNLNRILGLIESSAKRGADFVLLPEMALTGYDDQSQKSFEEKMQYKLAESIPGPATAEIEKVTKKYQVYAFVGMPEIDQTTNKIYNSMAIFGPEGLIGSYRKMHLPGLEPNWATRGNSPRIIATPWGPVGCAICYDTWTFPELMRFYAAKGCRLYVNITATSKIRGKYLANANIEAGVIRDCIFVASANLGGKDLYNDFWGGSSVVGPGEDTLEAYYYIGGRYTDPKANESRINLTTIDLSLASRYIYEPNPLLQGKSDFRPDIYAKMYHQLATEFAQKGRL